MTVLGSDQSGSHFRDSLRKHPLKHWTELLIKAALVGCAFISLATTTLIIIVLFRETIAFFGDVSFSEFLLDTEWQPFQKPGSFGIGEAGGRAGPGIH